MSTRSPRPASPASVSACAPRARPKRVISAKPRAISAARALRPSPAPSTTPQAMASTFLTAPPISAPTMSVDSIGTEMRPGERPGDVGGECLIRGGQRDAVGSPAATSWAKVGPDSTAMRPSRGRDRAPLRCEQRSCPPRSPWRRGSTAHRRRAGRRARRADAGAGATTSSASQAAELGEIARGADRDCDEGRVREEQGDCRRSALIAATTSGSRAQSRTGAPSAASNLGKRGAPGAAADHAEREMCRHAFTRHAFTPAPRTASAAGSSGQRGRAGDVERIGQARREALGAGPGDHRAHCRCTATRAARRRAGRARRRALSARRGPRRWRRRRRRRPRPSLRAQAASALRCGRPGNRPPPAGRRRRCRRCRACPTPRRARPRS